MERNSTVDLSKARAGDTVKFRCGGMAVIDELVWESSVRVTLYPDNNKVGLEYFDHGRHAHNLQLLDITEVIPAPVAFDWSTARWGMGFINGIGSVYIYCGGRGMATDDPIFYAKGTCDLRPIPTASLTRAPEHDVEA